MYVKTGRFVYGKLQTPLVQPSGYESLIGTAEPEYAVEIIREYGANELVGKLYRRGYSGEWIPVDPGTLERPEPRHRFPRGSPGGWKFEMAGSGVWKVLHLRIESDETGPYVAIALRYSE